MSKTDIDAVHSEYEKWAKERADDLPPEVDPFEAFCAETLLKDYNLSDADLLSSIVGKSRDGGCDALFFLVGGKMVRDNTPIPEQKGLSAHLIFMQAKRSDGFSCLQVDRLDVLTDDLLDIPRLPSAYRRTYHDKLLGLMKLFKDTFRKLTAPRLVIVYYYVTTLDADTDEDCRKSAAKLMETVLRHFSRADVHEFHFINAPRLYNLLFERPAFAKHLQFAEVEDGKEGHFGLVRLADFYSFLKGDDGELIERIFDDNVRGFQIDTKVNESILYSLTHPEETPEFWLLNNGITILSPDAPDSQGGKLYRITDPQIVNGLQTSRQVFDYYKAGENIPAQDNRRILVRLIQTHDEKIRESIIRATNKQNPMPAEALYTTSRTHKQLEGLFETAGWYYERRKGYWRDKRKPMSKIINSLALVQAILAIAQGDPSAARGRPLDHINVAERRYKLFGHDDYDESKPMPPEVAMFRPYDFDVYLRCWEIIRRMDKFLNVPRLRLDNEAKRNLLYYVARFAACVLKNTAYLPPGDIIAINVADLTDDFLRLRCLPYVKGLYKRMGGNDEAGKNPKMGMALQKYLIKTISPPNKSEAA